MLKIKEWIDNNDSQAPIIVFSAEFESKLASMDKLERETYLKETNATSALNKIILQGLKALQLEYFFTAGPDEVKAWMIQVCFYLLWSNNNNNKICDFRKERKLRRRLEESTPILKKDS